PGLAPLRILSTYGGPTELVVEVHRIRHEARRPPQIADAPTSPVFEFWSRGPRASFDFGAPASEHQPPRRARCRALGSSPQRRPRNRPAVAPRAGARSDLGAALTLAALSTSAHPLAQMASLA